MISNPYVKAFGLTTIFTALLFLACAVIAKIAPGWLYSYQWYLLLYFYLITLLSLFIIERTTRKNLEKLSKGFFSAMMLRLFVSIIIAVVIIYFDRANSTIFALNFLILYLVYLGFEIYYLISILQPRLNGERQIKEKK
jgi:L-asparagine transporter-like permease